MEEKLAKLDTLMAQLVAHTQERNDILNRRMYVNGVLDMDDDDFKRIAIVRKEINRLRNNMNVIKYQNNLDYDMRIGRNIPSIPDKRNNKYASLVGQKIKVIRERARQHHYEKKYPSEKLEGDEVAN